MEDGSGALAELRLQLEVAVEAGGELFAEVEAEAGALFALGASGTVGGFEGEDFWDVVGFDADSVVFDGEFDGLLIDLGADIDR